MAINAYLHFKGNCREALEFYAEVFDAKKPQIMTFAELPPAPDKPALAEELENWVMHAQLTIHGSTIMFSDVFPEIPLIVGNNITLAITNDNLDGLKHEFNKLAETGTLVMGFQETPWSKGYGYVIDKFGIGWQLSYIPH